MADEGRLRCRGCFPSAPAAAGVSNSCRQERKRAPPPQANFGQGLVWRSESARLGHPSHSVGRMLLCAQDGSELCIFPEE